MAEVAHSTIGASGMERWENCPGSVRLCAGIPGKSSSYAEEGTKAHEFVAHFLETNGDTPKDIPLEMVEAGMVYIKTILSDEAMPPIPGVLRVYDFKYGAGVPVEAGSHEEGGNPQLMYYALGALLSIKPNGKLQRLVEHRFDLSSLYPGLFGTADCVLVPPQAITDVELVIVQPRCPHPSGPVRRYMMDAGYLKSVFGTRLIEAAKRTANPDAPLIPGDHCRFCAASGVCPKLHERALSVAKEEFRKDLSYDPMKLKAALEWIPALKTWIAGVEEFAESEALAGRVVPGFKLVKTRGVRQWKPGIDEKVLCLETGLELEKLTTRKLVSPAQCEKLLTREERELIEQFVTMESKGLALAPESDKRPPALPDPATEFSVIETEAVSIFD